MTRGMFSFQISIWTTWIAFWHCDSERGNVSHDYWGENLLISIRFRWPQWRKQNQGFFITQIDFKHLYQLNINLRYRWVFFLEGNSNFFSLPHFLWRIIIIHSRYWGLSYASLFNNKISKLAVGYCRTTAPDGENITQDSYSAPWQISTLDRNWNRFKWFVRSVMTCESHLRRNAGNFTLFPCL